MIVQFEMSDGTVLRYKRPEHDEIKDLLELMTKQEMLEAYIDDIRVECALKFYDEHETDACIKNFEHWFSNNNF